MLTPLPLSHFVTHPGTPQKVRHTSWTPRFLVGLVQKSRTKAPCTNSLSIVRGAFCPGGFCPFPLLSEYSCYNRKVNITLNFMFHMYDKKCISVTSHAPPPPVTNCHTFSDPLPFERDVLYGRPLNRLRVPADTAAAGRRQSALTATSFFTSSTDRGAANTQMELSWRLLLRPKGYPRINAVTKCVVYLGSSYKTAPLGMKS